MIHAFLIGLAVAYWVVLLSPIRAALMHSATRRYLLLCAPSGWERVYNVTWAASLLRTVRRALWAPLPGGLRPRGW